MEKLSVTAEQREVGKKGLNRRIRGSGKIPAVLYGHGQQPTGLALHAKEFTHLMKGVGGTNALINLQVTGVVAQDGSGGPLVVMVKDYQTDKISHHITHVDLYKVDLKKKVTVKVPVHLTGKCIGTVHGGLVELICREVELRCLPANIPSKIEVDIEALDVGHSIHASELKLPEGIELSQEGEVAIVSVVAPREEVAAEAAPVSAGGGEGAIAPAAEGGATPAAQAPAGAAPAAGAKAEGKGEKK